MLDPATGEAVGYFKRATLFDPYERILPPSGSSALFPLWREPLAALPEGKK